VTYISKPYPKEGKEGEASKVHCQSDSKEARKWQVNYGVKKIKQKYGASPSCLHNVKDALALKFHTFSI